jgi:hypothetical protein
LKKNLPKNSITQTQPAGNSDFAKVVFQYSADSLVVNQTLHLRINICSKNATFAKPPKRYHQFVK